MVIANLPWPNGSFNNPPWPLVKLKESPNLCQGFQFVEEN